MEVQKGVLIFFGDYGLICACYGLSGASGLRPCLFCLETKKEMQQLPSAQPVMNSLEPQQNDYLSFQADGARLPRAKLFDNVICPAHLLIPPGVGMYPSTTSRPGNLRLDV